jgi:archaeal chaperonin
MIMDSKQPVYILPENAQRVLGKDAQRNNIMAAKIVADIIKTTLGPKGMDKMLVSANGDITITNDGVTILEEMEVEHPAAKMMVEIARTQEKEVGDGTTTAVMLAGKLLEYSEELLDNKIHPTTIIRGYQKAAEKAQEILKEASLKVETAQNIDEVLQSIVKTSITGKGAEVVKEKYADIIVRAVKQVAGETVDLSDIKISKIKGGSIDDTELIEGVVLDCPRVNKEMPRAVKNARIALIDAPLEAKGPEAETKISISTPEQLQSFIDREERMLRNIVEKIKSVGANVIFAQKGIDEIAQYYLTQEGIYAVRRVPRTDMERLAKATGGKIVSNIKELASEQLGSAQLVEEVKESDEEFTYIRGCKNPKSLTILIRGGTEHVIDEIQRAINDGVGVVATVIKEGMIVAGGGAVEIEIARRLRQFSHTLNGREQLAVEKFALALEQIPFTLAENAGLDPIDMITKLKSAHDAGNRNHGLNLFTGNIEDNILAGIVEPSKIKQQAINSATEVATMILRIDDVIAANPRDRPQNMRNSNPLDHMD